MTSPTATERQPISLMPADPHDAIQQMASQLRARIASLTQLVELTIPDSPARARIIAAQRGLQHELAEQLTIVDFLCYSTEHKVGA